MAPLEHPRGIYTARVDAKGRLKIPAAFVKYLEAQDKHFFVTSLNERSFYIYTLPQWKKIEAVWKTPADSREFKVYKAQKFIAGKYGADATIDGEGRMLIPQPLREKLNVHDKQVWLEWANGPIEIYGEEVYREKEREADPATLALGEELLALKLQDSLQS